MGAWAKKSQKHDDVILEWSPTKLIFPHFLLSKKNSFRENYTLEVGVYILAVKNLESRYHVSIIRGSGNGIGIQSSED